MCVCVSVCLCLCLFLFAGRLELDVSCQSLHRVDNSERQKVVRTWLYLVSVVFMLSVLCNVAVD